MIFVNMYGTYFAFGFVVIVLLLLAKYFDSRASDVTDEVSADHNVSESNAISVPNDWVSPSQRKSNKNELVVKTTNYNELTPKRNKSVAISVDGISYPSMASAIKKLKISKTTLHRRLSNDKFPNYKYL